MTAPTFLAAFGLPQACKANGCDGGACFYCDNPLSLRHEHDHFPVPYRAGGNHVVPACYNCHDLKDRMALAEWQPAVLCQATVDLVGALGINPELLPAETVNQPERALRHLMRVVVSQLDLHESPAWARLPVAARLLYAKLAGLMTGDAAVGFAVGAPERRAAMARWVDRDSGRYSDVGPTTATDAESAREALEMTPTMRRCVLKLHAAGESVSAIAASFKVGRDTVYRVIRAAGEEGE